MARLELALSLIRGDHFGIALPAHPDALIAAGATFLTEAFHATGALDAGNRVRRIVRADACKAGSTGRKLFLSVEYEHAAPDLHSELFVKFSRDFDDPIRDRGRNQLEAEVQLALLSRDPSFPIAVPRCYFADYQRDSGTGLVIAQRIAFDRDGVERAYEKCRDFEMPHALEHYRALLTAVARLAGAHQGGRLPAHLVRDFRFDVAEAMARDRLRYSADQLLRRVDRIAELAAAHPRLLPAHLTTPEFFATLRSDVPRFVEHEAALHRHLLGDPRFIALCHWNANVDNAWFWRDACGALQCGLLDWGRVGQMSIAHAIFGALSAAERSMWDSHLDELLTLFAREFSAAGGAQIDPLELRSHVLLTAKLMGLVWLFDAPVLIKRQLPDLPADAVRFDPGLRADETARVQLHMLTTVLNAWTLAQPFLPRFLM